MSEDKIKLKHVRNIFTALTRDENSIFYGADRITNTLVWKVKKSGNQKAFFTFYKDLDEKK